MTEFEQLIRDAGEGWMIDMFAPSDNALHYLSEALAAADHEYKRRFGGHGEVLSPKMLVKEFQSNSSKTRAFLQALGATRTPAMLVMVWRILLGSAVARVEMTYVLKSKFGLTVALVAPDGNDEDRYESNDIVDAALLRHLGIMKMNGRPIFGGFYALKVDA